VLVWFHLSASMVLLHHQHLMRHLLFFHHTLLLRHELRQWFHIQHMQEVRRPFRVQQIQQLLRPVQSLAILRHMVLLQPSTNRLPPAALTEILPHRTRLRAASHPKTKEFHDGTVCYDNLGISVSRSI
jgi:hypothetical protein